MENNDVGPLVSIGFGTYKGIDYIEKALTCLTTQSYQNIELIISDNGSTDGSGEVCRAFASRDSRIQLYRQERNIGIPSNFNFLLQKANGKYFMWAADDDLWHPDFISTLVKALEENPNAASAMSQVVFFDDNEKRIESLAKQEKTDYSSSTAFKRLIKFVKRFEDSMTYGLFRRDVIEKITFPSWNYGITKNDPINTSYPIIAYLLTKGNFVLAGDVPMWYNRIKNVNLTHGRRFPNSFARYLYAFVIGRMKLISKTISYIKQAGGNNGLVIRLLPSMIFYWLITHTAIEFVHRYRLLLKGKIQFF